MYNKMQILHAVQTIHIGKYTHYMNYVIHSEIYNVQCAVYNMMYNNSMYTFNITLYTDIPGVEVPPWLPGALLPGPKDRFRLTLLPGCIRPVLDPPYALLPAPAGLFHERFPSEPEIEER